MGSERSSSPRPRIAKQNRTRRRAVRRTGLYCVHPVYEDAIWQSEARLKGASGVVPRGTRKCPPEPPTCEKEAKKKPNIPKKINYLLLGVGVDDVFEAAGGLVVLDDGVGYGFFVAGVSGNFVPCKRQIAQIDAHCLELFA